MLNSKKVLIKQSKKQHIQPVIIKQEHQWCQNQFLNLINKNINDLSTKLNSQELEEQINIKSEYINNLQKIIEEQTQQFNWDDIKHIQQLFNSLAIPNNKQSPRCLIQNKEYTLNLAFYIVNPQPNELYRLQFQMQINQELQPLCESSLIDSSENYAVYIPLPCYRANKDIYITITVIQKQNKKVLKVYKQQINIFNDKLQPVTNQKQKSRQTLRQSQINNSTDITNSYQIIESSNSNISELDLQQSKFSSSSQLQSLHQFLQQQQLFYNNNIRFFTPFNSFQFHIGQIQVNSCMLNYGYYDTQEQVLYVLSDALLQDVIRNDGTYNKQINQEYEELCDQIKQIDDEFHISDSEEGVIIKSKCQFQAQILQYQSDISQLYLLERNVYTCLLNQTKMVQIQEQKKIFCRELNVYDKIKTSDQYQQIVINNKEINKLYIQVNKISCRKEGLYKLLFKSDDKIIYDEQLNIKQNINDEIITEQKINSFQSDILSLKQGANNVNIQLCIDLPVQQILDGKSILYLAIEAYQYPLKNEELVYKPVQIFQFLEDMTIPLVNRDINIYDNNYQIQIKTQVESPYFSQNRAYTIIYNCIDQLYNDNQFKSQMVKEQLLLSLKGIQDTKSVPRFLLVNSLYIFQSIIDVCIKVSKIDQQNDKIFKQEYLLNSYITSDEDEDGFISQQQLQTRSKRKQPQRRILLEILKKFFIIVDQSYNINLNYQKIDSNSLFLQPLTTNEDQTYNICNLFLYNLNYDAQNYVYPRLVLSKFINLYQRDNIRIFCSSFIKQLTRNESFIEIIDCFLECVIDNKLNYDNDKFIQDQETIQILRQIVIQIANKCTKYYINDNSDTQSLTSIKQINYKLGKLINVLSLQLQDNTIADCILLYYSKIQKYTDKVQNLDDLYILFIVPFISGLLYNNHLIRYQYDKSIRNIIDIIIQPSYYENEAYNEGYQSILSLFLARVFEQQQEYQTYLEILFKDLLTKGQLIFTNQFQQQEDFLKEQTYILFNIVLYLLYNKQFMKNNISNIINILKIIDSQQNDFSNVKLISIDETDRYQEYRYYLSQILQQQNPDNPYDLNQVSNINQKKKLIRIFQNIFFDQNYYVNLQQISQSEILQSEVINTSETQQLIDTDKLKALNIDLMFLLQQLIFQLFIQMIGDQNLQNKTIQTIIQLFANYIQKWDFTDNQNKILFYINKMFDTVIQKLPEQKYYLILFNSSIQFINYYNIQLEFIKEHGNMLIKWLSVIQEQQKLQVLTFNKPSDIQFLQQLIFQEENQQKFEQYFNMCKTQVLACNQETIDQQDIEITDDMLIQLQLKHYQNTKDINILFNLIKFYKRKDRRELALIYVIILYLQSKTEISQFSKQIQHIIETFFGVYINLKQLPKCNKQVMDQLQLLKITFTSLHQQKFYLESQQLIRVYIQYQSKITDQERKLLHQQINSIDVRLQQYSGVFNSFYYKVQFQGNDFEENDQEFIYCFPDTYRHVIVQQYFQKQYQKLYKQEKLEVIAGGPSKSMKFRDNYIFIQQVQPFQLYSQIEQFQDSNCLFSSKLEQQLKIKLEPEQHIDQQFTKIFICQQKKHFHDRLKQMEYQGRDVIQYFTQDFLPNLFQRSKIVQKQEYTINPIVSNTIEILQHKQKINQFLLTDKNFNTDPMIMEVQGIVCPQVNCGIEYLIKKYVYEQPESILKFLNQNELNIFKRAVRELLNYVQQLIELLQRIVYRKYKQSVQILNEKYQELKKNISKYINE